MSDKPVNRSHKELFKEHISNWEDAPGSIAEFGVASGATTRMLARLAPNRRVWAFDTFEGMPREDYTEALDYHNPPGKFNPHKTVEELFRGVKNITPVIGRFADTLDGLTMHPKIFLAYIDCDYYASHKQVLEWLPSRLLPGAMLVFDDYKNCPGAKKAIDEFVEKYNLKLTENEKVVIW